MNEYNIKKGEYEKYLSKLSKQLIIDIENIVLEKTIEYELKRTSSDIVIYLFEYGHELYDLTFYGCDKNFDSYVKPIFLPTKFPGNEDCITPKSIVLFEKEKFINICENKLNDEEKILFNKYLSEKKLVFGNWFVSCWKSAVSEIELKKGAYFSIHDTDDRIDLTTMKEINDNEIISNLNK